MTRSPTALPTAPFVSGSPVGDHGADDVEPGFGWVLRVGAVVLAFVGITLWRSVALGIPLRDPQGEFLVTRIAITAGLFALLAVVDALRRVPRGQRTLQAIRTMIRGRWPRRRLLLAGGGLLGYHLVYFCYHNLKSWDVFNRPRDHLLTAVDRALFLGHSPAVLLHDVLGEHWAAYVLMVIYESFPTLVTVSFVAAVVLVDRLRDGFVFLGSMIWCWILGVVSYYAIPSLGPFHDRPQDFTGLPHTLVTQTQERYLAQRAHLLAEPRAHDAFAQVSAFASLHVAVTTVIVLMLAYYRMRGAALVGLVYLLATTVATIYLGWHFAVDDGAGVLVGAVAVLLGQLTVYPGGRGRASPRSQDVGRLDAAR